MDISSNNSPTVIIDLYDPALLSLPINTATQVDGTTVTDGMLAVMPNSGFPYIYRADVTGISISWVRQYIGQDPNTSPAYGDIVFVRSGVTYSNKFYYYKNDSTWGSINGPEVLPGTAINNTIRWNGTQWVPETIINIDTFGNLYVPNDAVADSTKAQSLTVKAANKTAGTGDGGNLNLSAGLSVGGVDGDVVLSGNSAVMPTKSIDPTAIDGGVYFNTSTGKLKYAYSGSWTDVGAGSGSTVIADLYDPITTVLPTGSVPTIDGELLQDQDTVLFTNLNTNNNRVYRATITAGPTISWFAESDFIGGSPTPTPGEQVTILSGNSFANQKVSYTATGDWLVNDVVRYFDGSKGLDYWEKSSIKTVNLANNTSNATIFSVVLSGSENWVLNYSIVRGVTKETGQIYITTNGTDVSLSVNNTFLSDTGTSFSAIISGSDLVVRYTTTNTGSAGVLKFFYSRWSDSVGGPAGVPSYSTGSGSSIPAAGLVSNVQYKGSDGNLAGDSAFSWDDAAKTLILDGLTLSTLQGPVNLLNNTVSPTVALTYPATTKFVILEYSIERDGDLQVGRFMIASNGVIVGLTDDSVTTGPIGILFTADILTSNVRVLYTSTNTGFNASFKYSIRSWS